jgi:hypothetical protein
MIAHRSIMDAEQSITHAEQSIMHAEPSIMHAEPSIMHAEVFCVHAFLRNFNKNELYLFSPNKNAPLLAGHLYFTPTSGGRQE